MITAVFLQKMRSLEEKKSYFKSNAIFVTELLDPKGDSRDSVMDVEKKVSF
jgi:hypothetical protein